MYSITSVSRRMRWTGYVAGMGEKRNAYRCVVRRHHFDDVEVEWRGMDSSGSGQRRVASSCE